MEGPPRASVLRTGASSERGEQLTVPGPDCAGVCAQPCARDDTVTTEAGPVAL